MSRIALITDGQGWIVDRISRIYQAHNPAIDLFFLPSLSVEGLVHLARNYQLIHFNNWFVRGMQPFLDVCPVPTLVSIRSFRYKADIPAMRPSRFHIIHPDMAVDFQNSVFIPDGIDLDEFKPSRRFRVGICYQAGFAEFKGVHLLKQAIEGLDIELVEASGLDHAAMKAFYESLDLYVCASESEGFAAPVVECMALNVPVMSTATGVASFIPGIQVVERSVAGLRQGLMAHLGRERIAQLAWPNICARVNAMYAELLAR
jgi:glycosyltransferase involved in cell wall biosynthesis